MKTEAKAALNDTTYRVRRHYRNIGLERGWKWERFQTFCRHFPGMTEREVAALFNIDERELWHPTGLGKNQMAYLFDKRGVRKRLPVSTSTYLAWVESAILEYHGVVSRPVLPFELMNLNQSVT